MHAHDKGKPRNDGKPRMLTPREALDIAGELTEEDVESGRLESLCVKWVADEAETLSGASLMLRDFAERLLELELDGWQLVDPSTVVTASWGTTIPRRGCPRPLDSRRATLA